MGGPRGSHALPNCWSHLGLSPRQIAKQVGVTFSFAKYVIFGHDCQHHPSRLWIKARTQHSILPTKGQERTRPQTKRQGRNTTHHTYVWSSQPIRVLLTKKRATQGKLKGNTQNLPKDISGVFNSKDSSTLTSQQIMPKKFLNL